MIALRLATWLLVLALSKSAAAQTGGSPSPTFASEIGEFGF